MKGSKASNDDNIRVIVAIDFGVTHSTFAYANKLNHEVIVNDSWPEQHGPVKTNTALLYDENFISVEAWGYAAFGKPKRRGGNVKDQTVPKVVEKFKLHMVNIPENEKPPLPKGLPYTKFITDYLREMGKKIKETIITRWPNLMVMEQVLFILTIPPEFSDEQREIMRECIYNAGLIVTEDSEKLQFITETDAAAIYCMKCLKENLSNLAGKNLLIVDFGDNTVDLITRQLLSDERLGEISIRTGGSYGETFIDNEFLKFVGNKVGSSAIKSLQENHNNYLQYMIKEFSEKVKFLFTGQREDYKSYELDLDEVCPVIKTYVTSEKLDQLVEDEWIIEVTFEDVKQIFDPLIKSIIKLIHDHLNRSGTVSAMFLVGGLSDSKYLQKRIHEEFSTEIRIISTPRQPTTATVKGALEYGLNMQKAKSRILPLSYGIELGSVWKPSEPSERHQTHNRIFKFRRLVERGREVDVDQEFGLELYPSYENQTEILIEVYVTTAIEATYCDEPGMRKIVELRLDFPDPHLGYQRTVKFTLTFGQTEVYACAKNKQGKSTTASFKLNF
ncbi:hypothetical protein C1645_870960 [Glomus cerebriforme]|uniref:Actin-like ATPase domain-containing protein n=1 Tax=Glomus cerebriforme TaxID=658196 RepID=A0A397TNM1_9GLOM|nr:hypothetical protein C1645_870960 [Glomus cerebriforme]